METIILLNYEGAHVLWAALFYLLISRLLLFGLWLIVLLKPVSDQLSELMFHLSHDICIFLCLAALLYRYKLFGVRLSLYVWLHLLVKTFISDRGRDSVSFIFAKHAFRVVGVETVCHWGGAINVGASIARSWSHMHRGLTRVFGPNRSTMYRLEVGGEIAVIVDLLSWVYSL